MALSDVTNARPLAPRANLVVANNSLHILLYPVGPVGCAPQVSKAMKSSTCKEGGRDVFGGRDLNKSPRCGAVRGNPLPLIGVTKNKRFAIK